MKSKHLALITLHADPATPAGAAEGGGTHSYIRELMIALPKNNWKITILTRWADVRLPEFETISSALRIIRLRIGEVNVLNKRLLNNLHPVSLTAVEKALATGSKVDLIHSVYWNSGRVAMDLSKKLGVRFVHTVISNGWRRLRQGATDQPASRLKVEKRVFTSAFAVFCVSGQERKDLIDHYAVDPKRIVVVGRPVAYSFRQPSHNEKGQPFLSFSRRILMTFPTGANRYSHWWLDRCFLYVGRMAESKGVSEILRAWLELADDLGASCPPLWLVGGEPNEIETIRRSIAANF